MQISYHADMIVFYRTGPSVRIGTLLAQNSRQSNSKLICEPHYTQPDQYMLIDHFRGNKRIQRPKASKATQFSSSLIGDEFTD